MILPKQKEKLTVVLGVLGILRVSEWNEYACLCETTHSFHTCFLAPAVGQALCEHRLWFRCCPFGGLGLADFPGGLGLLQLPPSTLNGTSCSSEGLGLKKHRACKAARRSALLAGDDTYLTP